MDLALTIIGLIITALPITMIFIGRNERMWDEHKMWAGIFALVGIMVLVCGICWSKP